MVIRHSCDNPPCTNPAHLLVGTHADNVADRVTRSRNAVGEAHGIAKLTESDVAEIRNLYSAGIYQRIIAQQFGISQSNVSYIVNHVAWQHV